MENPQKPKPAGQAGPINPVFVLVGKIDWPGSGDQPRPPRWPKV